MIGINRLKLCKEEDSKNTCYQYNEKDYSSSASAANGGLKGLKTIAQGIALGGYSAKGAP